MQLHEVCTLFPQYTHEEMVALSDRIKKFGQRKPILTFKGKICDGRNRHEACLMAGVEPKFEEFVGTEEEMREHVIDLNLHRRHLSESQRAIIAAKLQKQIKGKPGAEVAASEEAARRMNVSTRSVFRATEVVDKAIPEVLDLVEKGKATVNDAAKVSRLPRETQKESAEKVAKGESRKLTPKVNQGSSTPYNDQFEQLMGKVIRLADDRFNAGGRHEKELKHRDLCLKKAGELKQAWKEWIQ